MKDVTIRGDGVAAYCCLRALQLPEIRVALDRTDRPRLPVIMLGDAAVALIRDVFGQSDLLRGLPRVEKRVVAWGPDADPIVVDHSAIVVSEVDLLDSLRASLGPIPSIDNDARSAWTIFSSRPLPPDAIEHRFGSRRAWAAPVELKEEGGPLACCIESLEAGWLFLIPNSPAAGWLLSVGTRPDKLLGDSRVAASKIQNVHATSAEFPAYPRIFSPLCGPEWLACGTAAMAFDPICGDGTANAIREAILACAVIRAASQSPDQELCSHYQARLTMGFERHLEQCRAFYRSGGSGPWWQAESGAIDDGLEWCAQQLRGRRAFRYRLDGFELHALPH